MFNFVIRIYSGATNGHQHSMDTPARGSLICAPFYPIKGTREVDYKTKRFLSCGADGDSICFYHYVSPGQEW